MRTREMLRMCPVCDGFATEISIHGPAQLRRIIGKIRQAVHDRRLLADDGPARIDVADQPRFADLDPDGTLPDHLRYRFRCQCCNRHFMLECETYHGAGGRWAVAGP